MSKRAADTDGGGGPATLNANAGPSNETTQRTKNVNRAEALQPSGPASARAAQARRGSGGDGGNANGLVAVSIIVALAAVAAGYWTFTTTNRPVKPAPPDHPLRAVAQRLLHPDKGILAADESPATFGKRLASTVRNNAGIRRQWRRVLLTTRGLEQHISGVIFHEETLQQLPEELRALAARGVAVGVKLDQGTVPLPPKKAGEHATKGLEGLAERCRVAAEQGATFAKWRAVFRVGPHTPSKAAVKRNSGDLAEYAAVVQKCGLVPILEPEVLADGAHDLSRTAAATGRVLRGVVRALRHRGDVDPGAVLLKVAFVTPGSGAREQAAPGQVANATLRLLARTVPRVVPGIVFLSGGQSEEVATAHMLAVGRLVKGREAAGKPPLPWSLSFSFGRALQTSALAAWQRGDVAAAQEALLARAQANAQAQRGQGAREEGG